MLEQDAVVSIHGGLRREERQLAQETFVGDSEVTVLVATDGAGEGVNLQRAKVLVNYDLPWNPNRIEQRFGRIHRIGQTEVCHLWNLVAAETREGLVFERLFEKLAAQGKALGGRDVLGQVFAEESLRDLLIEAIRYGDRPEVRARLDEVVDAAVGENLRRALRERALISDVLSPVEVEAVRERMEDAEARRLQPHFIRSFFLEAFGLLGGQVSRRESGRYEIRHVPADVRAQEQAIRATRPILRRYERVTMLVVSIPASDLEVGGEGGHQALVRLLNVVGRMETSWKPATADEGFEIVRRRLFEPVPPNLARERNAAVHAFGELYRSQRAEFPSECGEGEYERRLHTAYPIHPELFDRLYGEWSTLERFQRTRGVLRLMAAVIYELWRREDRSVLIMPGMLPIEASQVVDELTRYLDEPWTPVISTDIDGENALPLRIDNQNPAFMRYSASRRVARTIFLGSAPIKEAANRGIDDRRVKLGCVQPGEPPATFGDSLRRLSNEALYLSTDGQRHWYSLQQTVTRLAADRAALVREDQVDHEIETRLRSDRARGDFVRVHHAAGGPGDVDDEGGVRLVVLGPTHPHSGKSEESPARDSAQRPLDDRAGGPRLNRNMLVFAAPDSARLEELRDAIRNYMAWDSISREQDSLNLDTVQRSQVQAGRHEWDESGSQRVREGYHGCSRRAPRRAIPRFAGK